MDAAAKVMGPRPGLVILKFWQGIVEMVLRVIAIVCSIATLIASAIAIRQINSLPEGVIIAVDVEIESETSLDYRSMIFNSLSAGAIGVGISLLFIIYELVPIILRFLNIGLINYKIKIFLGIDIAITFVLASVFGIGGILAAFMAVQWSRLEDNLLVILAVGGSLAIIPDTRDVLAATAGTSLVAALFMSFLMTWAIFFLVQKWNNKVIKETVKSAI